MIERDRNTQVVMPSSGIKAIGFADVGRSTTKPVHVVAAPSVDQQAQRAGVLVLAAVWWELKIVTPSAVAIYDPAWKLIDRFFPEHGQRVASFLQLHLVPFLLFDFIVWPIAEDHLRAMWNAELADQNRRYAAKGGKP
jgi:hypothetical protein